MNKGQKNEVNTSYTVYILLGALYVLIKIAFVLAGYLHPGAILHGLIPSALTVVVGYLALIELKKSGAVFWHKVMMILPLLIFIITPIYMYLKEKAEWLINGRLEVLIIYELMAAVQFYIAFKRLKNMPS